MACPGIVSVSSATASVCPAASDALRETPRAPYQQQPPPLLAGAVLLPIGSEALLAAAMLGCVAMRVLISDACEPSRQRWEAENRTHKVGAWRADVAVAEAAAPRGMLGQDRQEAACVTHHSHEGLLNIRR